MEYLHRRKESPMQGMTGLWGGVGSNLIPSAGGYPPAPGSADPVSPNNGYTGDGLPITGGANWFSPGYLGYEDESSYQFPNNKTLDQIYYQRLQNGAYQWWFLVWERASGSNDNFTVRYGARIAVPDGTGTNQEGPFTLSQFEEIGSASLPNDGETYVVGWNSGVSGDQQVGPPHYADATSGGNIGYHPHNSPDPTNAETVTFNHNETGEHFHVHVTWED